MVSLHCQKRHRLLLSHNPPQNLWQVLLSTRSRARTPPGPALRFLLGGARSLLLQKLHPRMDGSAVRLDRVRNSLISSPCGAPAEMLLCHVRCGGSTLDGGAAPSGRNHLFGLAWERESLPLYTRLTVCLYSRDVVLVIPKNRVCSPHGPSLSGE